MNFEFQNSKWNYNRKVLTNRRGLLLALSIKIVQIAIGGNCRKYNHIRTAYLRKILGRERERVAYIIVPTLELNPERLLSNNNKHRLVNKVNQKHSSKVH